VLVSFAPAALATTRLTILYTNDLHARVERLESLAGLIADERRAGDPVLLLDAGDAWQDFRSPLPIVWGSEETAAWMSRVGYDAMAVGNHDLYLGAEQLASLASRAGFPLLCANLIPWASERAPFVPFTVVEQGGLRILVVGLITGDLLPYADFPWLRYEEPGVALRDALRAAEGLPRDLVVVLCHLPLAEARRLAEDVPGVDVFVTGHSHEATPEPLRVGSSLIVQSRPFGLALGRLRIEWNPAGSGPELVDNTLLDSASAAVDVRPGLERLAGLGLLLAGLVTLFLL